MKTIFEQGALGHGLSLLPACDVPVVTLAPARKKPLRLPQVSENELIRHYTALSHRVHGMNDGFYPLGSCTMKYNPKVKRLRRCRALRGSIRSSRSRRRRARWSCYMKPESCSEK